MKPFQSGSILAAWLLRILLAWFVYRNYFSVFTNFDLSDFNFYIGAGYVVLALMLLIGGLMQQPTMTVISGLLIFVLPIVQLIREFPEQISSAAMLYLLPIAVGFSFFTGGNNK